MLSVVIWNPAVVDHFVNASLDFLVPRYKESDFYKDTETVGDCLGALPRGPAQARQDALQKRVMRSIITPAFHTFYSLYHTKAAYAYGAGDEETVRLGQIAAMGLDAPKLGLTINRDLERKDRQRWSALAMPPFYWRVKKSDVDAGFNPRALTRDVNLGPHPLVDLGGHTDSRIDECLAKVASQLQKSRDDFNADPDLDLPWLAFRRGSRDDRDEHDDVLVIENFVEEVFEDFQRCMAELASTQAQATQTDESTSARFARLDTVIARFHQGLTHDAPSIKSRQLRRNPDLVARLKASCAYCHHGRGGKRFPWDVAGADLCAIKAAAVNAGRPGFSVVNDVAEAMVVDKRLVKVPERDQLPVLITPSS